MKWIERRRRQRKERPSKFDVLPSEGATGTAQLPMMAVVPGAAPDAQQTRHARRLYIGNLPPNVHEQMIHDAFRSAIDTALGAPLAEDPILSVYINPERQFSFLEFKTVEMTTACLELDGLMMQGYPVKIKRPNDYNPMIAPRVHPSSLPQLDVSKLGIIASTVQDGPNKIFIGGLHYHFQDAQVMELLAAFGQVKSFHLVKNEQDPPNSKGYCFIEYIDPNLTPIAIQGLNGMDIGGGKSLTARLAGERSGGGMGTMPSTQTDAPEVIVPGAPPIHHTIVSGYDVEQLVDAALGKIPMPMVPQYMDAVGMPLTRIVSVGLQALSQEPAKTTVSNNGSSSAPTCVLVLHNMVTDEDLATEQDCAELVQEVREECTKYGMLKDLVIPRAPGKGVEPSAIRKIYLAYSNVSEALAAEKELKGRVFGEATVDTSYYSEADFAAGKLK
jgi:splicing factor U2AF subunit